MLSGNKGLIGLTTNPVIANGIAGLATSATAQATVEVWAILFHHLLVHTAFMISALSSKAVSSSLR